MKKSIIALAVAASTMASVAQADGTTLYGSARFDYVYTDNADLPNRNFLGQNVVGRGLGTGNSTSTVGNNSSRFGIRGTNDLGNGLTAGYQFEMGIGSGGVTERDTFVNLSGGFGTVQLGTFTLPYDDVVAYTDIFNGVGGGYALRDAELGVLPGRVSNVLAYVSPNFSGFTFTAGVVANGAATAAAGINGRDHMDAYQLTAAYDNNGIHAALGYLKVKDAGGAATNNDLDSLNLSLGYSTDQFMVGFSAERTSLDSWVNSDPVFYNLAARYNIDEANRIYASAGLYDYDWVNWSNAKAYGIGYQHNFSNTTRIWAEYEHLDTGRNDSAPGVEADRNTISLGIRTDF